MKTPSISVVIPMYNNAQHVEEALNSVKNQSFTDWKCFIIDDNSEDMSLAIVKHIIVADYRFQLIERSKFSDRKGANVCRNIGLNRVDSDLVLFLDADDYLATNCIMDRLLYIKKEPNYDMWLFHTDFVDIKGNYKGSFNTPSPIVKEIIYNLVKHKIPWHTMSPIWSVDFLRRIGGWNEEYTRLQDVELHLRALLKSARITFSKLSADSYYRYSNLTLEKQIKARMGFTRLIKDFYFKLNAYYGDDSHYLIKINDALQNSLETQFVNYIKFSANKDILWEELYIELLVILDIPTVEQDAVKHIFSKI